MPEYEYQDLKQGGKIDAPGTYDCEIVKVEDAISKNGNAMLVLSLADQESGSTIRDRLTFSAAAAWRIERMLKGVGIVAARGQKLTIDEKLLLGKTCTVIVGKERDSDYMEVKQYLSKGDGVPFVAKPATTDDDEIPF